MATDIGSIRPVNPYSIRRVNPKRDHDGKKDYPHQDADGFAEDLSELITEHEKRSNQGEQDAPAKEDTPQAPDRETARRDDPKAPSETPERPRPEHLDIEA